MTAHEFDELVAHRVRSVRRIETDEALADVPGASLLIDFDSLHRFRPLRGELRLKVYGILF
jgi:hypothetical protein